jgi:hypothetical protein
LSRGFVGLASLILISTAACSSDTKETPTATPSTAYGSASRVPMPTVPSPTVDQSEPSRTPSVPQTSSVDKSVPSRTQSVPPPTGLPDLGTELAPSDPYKDVQTNLKQLIVTEARWHRPDALKVKESESIGLQIGDSGELRQEITDNFPGTLSSSAGSVKVGPEVSVRLVGDPDEVTIVPGPEGPIVKSTDREVAMLFEWIVTPKIVTDDLHLKALVEVSLPNKPKLTTDEIPLSIRVKRTPAYTFNQLFTHWETWLAIGGVVLSFFERMRRFAAWPFRKLKQGLSKGQAPQAVRVDSNESAEDSAPKTPSEQLDTH